jgi:hypothetical protein
VTDRISADGDAFGVPLVHVWPSVHADAAAEVARRAVEALGIEDGPSYTQLRISRGGPEVIQVAARLGGGHDAELVELVTGIDLNGLALAAALGRPLEASDVVPPRPTGIGGAATLSGRAAGLLESVEIPQGRGRRLDPHLPRSLRLAPCAGASDGAGVVCGRRDARGGSCQVEAAAERIRVTADAEAMV